MAVRRRPPLPYVLTSGLARGLDLLTRRGPDGLSGDYRRWLDEILAGRPGRRDDDDEDVLSVTARFLHSCWLVVAVLAAVSLVPLGTGPLAVVAGSLLALVACTAFVTAGLGYLTDHGTARLIRHRLFTPVWGLLVLLLSAVTAATILF